MAGEISKEILAGTRARIGDRSGEIWSDADLYAFLNEAFMEVAMHLPDGALPQLTMVTETSLVAAQNNYDLPATFMRARAVYYKGLWAKHWPSSEKDALRDDALLVPSETNPFWWLENNDLYVSVGVAGPTQTGTEKVALWYIKQPTVISDSADPELHESLFDVVQTYAHARCMEPQQEFDVAQLMRSHFDEEAYLVALRWQTPRAFEGISYDLAPDALKPGR